MGKGKVRVFEQMVHEDDQLTHHGSEGDFAGFSGGNEPLIKRLEQMVAAAGRQGGHVKGSPHFGSATTDATLACPLSAVSVIRAESGQGGSLSPVELSQLRN